jgi:hypothetical protein
VDPVPDPLLLRKCGIAGNRTRTSGSVPRNPDRKTTDAVSKKHQGSPKCEKCLRSDFESLCTPSQPCVDNLVALCPLIGWHLCSREPRGDVNRVHVTVCLASHVQVCKGYISRIIRPVC